MSKTVSLVWFRADLRLSDNPVLAAAARAGAVVSVFVWSPEEEGKWAPGATSRWWQRQSLRALDAALRHLGSRLILTRGPTVPALLRLTKQCSAGALFFNHRYEPAARALEVRLAAAMEAAGIRVSAFHSALLFKPDQLATAAGRPYLRFTPFWRALSAAPTRPRISASSTRCSRGVGLIPKEAISGAGCRNLPGCPRAGFTSRGRPRQKSCGVPASRWAGRILIPSWSTKQRVRGHWPPSSLCALKRRVRGTAAAERGNHARRLSPELGSGRFSGRFLDRTGSCLLAHVCFRADWYPTLTKPAWTPPDWVFGPVWTLLYILMAVAAWLVWRKAGFAGARLALVLYFVQLALNAAWSGLFFGLRSPAAGLVDILLLWMVIAATLVAFARHSAVAAGLLVPYFVWVSYAAALNFAIWRMNP
jgi:tryptophan-rich sensory protein